MMNGIPSKALLPVVLVLLSACKDKPVVLKARELGSFRVTVTRSGGLGTAEQRVPLAASDLLTVKAEALKPNGQPHSEYNGQASLRVTPGTLGDPNGLLTFANGVANGTIEVRNVFGKTLLWVEDGVRYANGGLANDPTYATGIGGPVWYSSPTIYDIQKVTDASDNNALPLSYVTISEDLLSADKKMDLIVNAIFQDGFYVTDLASTPELLSGTTLPYAFGHMFVYTYNFPEDLFVGDRIRSVSGTVQEFGGDTQIVFPAWNIKVRPAVSLSELRKPVPAPVEINHDMCGSATSGLCGSSKQNFKMESQESALVRVGVAEPAKAAQLCDPEAGVAWGSTTKFRSFLSGVSDVNIGLWTDERIAQVCPLKDGKPSQYVNCDINRDSKIPFPAFPPSDGGFQQSSCALLETETLRLECECKEACNSDVTCAEQSTMRAFGQWSVTLKNPVDGKYNMKIGVVTNLAVPDWIPEQHPGVLVKITGVLRQTRAARPPWQVMASEGDSLCCMPDPADPTTTGLCPPEKLCK